MVNGWFLFARDCVGLPGESIAMTGLPPFTLLPIQKGHQGLVEDIRLLDVGQVRGRRNHNQLGIRDAGIHRRGHFNRCSRIFFAVDDQRGLLDVSFLFQIIQSSNSLAASDISVDVRLDELLPDAFRPASLFLEIRCGEPAF